MKIRHGGWVPLVLGLVLSLLGLIVLFTALAIETEGGDPVGPLGWRALLAVLLAVAGFGVALPRLGVIGAVACVVVVLSLAQAQPRWRGVLWRVAVFAALGWLAWHAAGSEPWTGAAGLDR